MRKEIAALPNTKIYLKATALALLSFICLYMLDLLKIEHAWVWLFIFVDALLIWCWAFSLVMMYESCRYGKNEYIRGLGIIIGGLMFLMTTGFLIGWFFLSWWTAKH